MKLSQYKEFLDQYLLIKELINTHLNKTGVPHESFQILEFYPGFIVLNIIHNGKVELTNINLWSIIEDKDCKWCH